MKRTDIVWPPEMLRDALGLKAEHVLGEAPVGTEYGEFRLDPNGQWRLWVRDDVTYERVEVSHA